ncbi:hypothetical protein [Actinokineospora sp. NPDC004072]
MTGQRGEGASAPTRAVLRAAGAVSVVAVLVAVCAVAWSLMGHRVPDPEDRAVPPVGVDGRYARDSLALVVYGNGREDYGSVRTFDQVVEMKFLSDREIAVFRAHGARAARATVASTLPEGKIVGVAVRMADRSAARAAADELNALWVAGGFVPAPDRTWVRRSELTGRERPIARAVYAHEALLVRVELTGKSEAALSADFTALLAPQLDLLPADG